MDHEWRQELDRLEARVLEAARALLEFSKASGTALTLHRSGETEPTFIIIGQADALDALHPRRELPEQRGDIARHLLDILPRPVREDVEAMAASGKESGRGKRRH